MNEAQVCLIKFGSSAAKIHSHPCEACAVCVWPTGTGWLWWLYIGRTTHLWAVKKSPFVSCINAVEPMMVCVLTPVRLQDNEESSLKPQQSALAAPLVGRCPREHRETLGTACLSIWKGTFWFHRWDLQRQKPDDCGMSRGRAVWFLWVAAGALGSLPPARRVLHLPSWRTRFRGLAQAQPKSSALPIPPLQSRPWGLIWSCQANPLVAWCQWHCWDHSLE